MIKLWLPLSNNVRNTGLQLISTTNNGATLINSGQTYITNLGHCNCHYFNGTTSGIKINDDVVSNLQQLTVCFWLYTTGTTVGSAFSFEVSQSWQFSCHNGLFSVRDNGSGTGGTRTDLSIGSIEANKWNHLCFMYDNGTMSIYKNGTLASTKQTSGTKLNIGITNNWIGRAHQGGNYFLNGYIRDFRVYDNILSDEDIKRINLDLAYELNSDMFFNAKIKYTNPILAKKSKFDESFFSAIENHPSDYYTIDDIGSISLDRAGKCYNGNPMYNNKKLLEYEFLKRNYGIFGDNLIFSYKLDNNVDNFNFSCKIYSPDINYNMIVIIRNGRRYSRKRHHNTESKVSVINIVNFEQEISINFSRKNRTPYFKIIISPFDKNNNITPPSYYAIKDVKLTEICDSLPKKTYFFDKSGIIQKKLKSPDTRLRLNKENILINPHHYTSDNSNIRPRRYALSVREYINFKNTKSYVIYFYPFKKRSLVSSYSNNGNKNYCINFGGDLVISYIYQAGAAYYCTSFILIKYKNNYYKLVFQGVESEHYIKELRKRFSLIIINFTQNNNNDECYDFYFNGIKLTEINSMEYEGIFKGGFSKAYAYRKLNDERSSVFNGYLNFFKEYNNTLPLSEIEKLNNYYCSDIINNRYIDRISPTERHEYVDFNLPSGNLWRTCNLGANTPYEDGKYFSWSTLVGYTDPLNTGVFYPWSYKQSAVTFLDMTRDAGYITLGKTWRIPSNGDFEELFEYTDLSFDSEKNCVICEKNGKKLFFPLNGFASGSSIYFKSTVRYWTRDNYSSSRAYGITITSGLSINNISYPRFYGFGIRPITNIGIPGLEK